jgi:hypothetical protein
MKIMERGLSECRWINVLLCINVINVWTEKDTINVKKTVAIATKHLKQIFSTAIILGRNILADTVRYRDVLGISLTYFVLYRVNGQYIQLDFHRRSILTNHNPSRGS